MDTKSKGRWGEDAALDHLENAGYELIERNFHTRYGEIDLIMKIGTLVVFVEVKLRRHGYFASALEYVNRSKQMKLRKTAELWLQKTRCALQPRLDVIEVYTDLDSGNEEIRINHLVNAF